MVWSTSRPTPSSRSSCTPAATFALFSSVKWAGERPQIQVEDGHGPGQDPVKMAQSDEDRVMAYKDKFVQAAARYGFRRLCLLRSQAETRGGSQLNEAGYSIYGGNEGFGLTADAGHHSPQDGIQARAHRAGCRHPRWIQESVRHRVGKRRSSRLQSPLTTAALEERTVSGMDSRTTGKDYSSDTWVRAQYYSRFFAGGPPLS